MEKQAERQHEVDVLLVDDDADLLRVTAELLGEHGYVVATAGDGALATEMAERTPPAVLVLDLDMPVMDGRELLQRWRSSVGPLASLPIIVVSAREAADEASALHPLVSGWLQKPLDPRRLVVAIERLLRPRPGSARGTAASG